jgi:hypothetical protein
MKMKAAWRNGGGNIGRTAKMAALAAKANGAMAAGSSAASWRRKRGVISVSAYLGVAA